MICPLVYMAYGDGYGGTVYYRYTCFIVDGVPKLYGAENRCGFAPDNEKVNIENDYFSGYFYGSGSNEYTLKRKCRKITIGTNNFEMLESGSVITQSSNTFYLFE